jgi:hypothetical protein
LTVEQNKNNIKKTFCDICVARGSSASYGVLKPRGLK